MKRKTLTTMVLAAAATLVAGCRFEPHYSDSIACGSGREKCPPGLVCSPDALCVRTLHDGAVEDARTDASDLADAASADVCLPRELCNGLDDDCNGSLPSDELDMDGDGYLPCGGCTTELAVGIQGCGDCLPMNKDAHPNAPEYCDGFDTDCSGGVGATEVDEDVDGYLACSFCGGRFVRPDLLGCNDCRDNDASISPLELDVCDGIDNDCDASTADGAATCAPNVEICCGPTFSCVSRFTTSHCVGCTSCDARSNLCSSSLGCVCGSTGAPCPVGMTCTIGTCQP